MNQKIGTLYGISVGTGDPELITVKGLRILRDSPIAAFPAGINRQDGVAQTIIKQYLQPHQKILPLSFPYTRSLPELTKAWRDVTDRVWLHLQQGLNVAFACEGDISFYSSFTYLASTLEELHPQVKIERIPGICSPMATASVLGVPLTMQHEKLVVLPALYTTENLEEALDWAETVVLMKVASVYSQVWKILQRRNLFASTYLVEQATTKDEKIYHNLENHPQLSLNYFSIMIICQQRLDEDGSTSES